ncbi:MAG: SDR family oxidoreductase [Sphingomonadaceae bacterium]|nr:MAG: SDR family oxidoreductase [Sphingomonadaceae bacterium]
MDIAKLMYREGFMEGERILVTGGGTGLGKVMAEAFLKLGASVHICGRREGKLQETADELMGRHGGSVSIHACDIRSHESIDEMISDIWQDGPLTGLVNNAAGNFVSRTEDLSVNGFNAIADTVFRGTFYMTHACGTRWIEQGLRGNVLSILTTWVWNGGPFVVPSAMSKAGINIMTQSLAVEWGRYGLRFNAIAPGLFPTEGMSARLSPEGRGGNSVDRMNPMGRHGEMHELANLAVFLMGPGAEWVNGQTIAIDGAGYQANSGNFYQALAPMGDEDWQRMRESIKGTNAKDKAQRTT